MTYKRLNLSTVNEDGTTGELIFQTPKPDPDDPDPHCFSFGVSENESQETKKVNGHSLPICLWSRGADGKAAPTKEEKQWTDKFDALVEHVKNEVVKRRDELEEPDLSIAELKKMNPIYIKKEKGKVVAGSSPTLYAKLIESKKNGQEKIVSLFYDSETGDEIDPLTLIKKYCHVDAYIKFESVYIGSGKHTLQVKLYNAVVKPLQMGVKRIVPNRPVPEKVMISNSTTNPMGNEEDENEGDKNSINGDEEEVAVVAPVVEKSAPVVKKPTRKAK